MTFVDPSFTDVWNSAYEGIPADTENINLGAGRIRDFKVSVRQRANVDHSWGDAADNGMHNQVSFNLSTAAPTSSTSNSFLFSETASSSGSMELYYEDNAGRITQLTSAGALDLPPPFPSGTRLIFPQAAPPTGWAFVGGWGDRVLRFVDDGTGGQLGGGWTISGLSASAGIGSLAASSSSSGSGSGSFSGTTDGHSISALELPPHSHYFTINTGGTGNGGPASGQYNAAQEQTEYQTDNGPGNGIPHSHTYSGSVSVGLTISTSTTLSGSPTASVAQDGSWRPAYANAVLGQKT